MLLRCRKTVSIACRISMCVRKINENCRLSHRHIGSLYWKQQKKFRIISGYKTVALKKSNTYCFLVNILRTYIYAFFFKTVESSSFPHKLFQWHKSSKYVSVLGEARRGVSGTAMLDSQRADFGLLMAQIGRVPWETKESRKAWHSSRGKLWRCRSTPSRHA